jgi:hypothetical protein
MRKRSWLFVLLLTVGACGGRNRTTTLSPPTILTPTTFQLSGEVTDSATGAGIPGATVSIIGGPNAGKSTTTIVTGHFVFIALPRSAFTVNVCAENYVCQSKDVTFTTMQTLSFQLIRSGIS